MQSSGGEQQRNTAGKWKIYESLQCVVFHYVKQKAYESKFVLNWRVVHTDKKVVSDF